MNKKTTLAQDDEVIKLTVSEVKPEDPVEEKPILIPEESRVSDSVSVVDDLYSEKTVETVSSPVSVPSKPTKSPKGGFMLFVGGLLLGGMVTGGIFNFVINPKAEENRSKVNGVVSIPTPVVEVTPEVTPMAEEIDYSKYSVKILNGSGVTGAAAKVKGLIEELTFKSVQTGNADVSNQKETEVSLKKGVPAAVFEELSRLLSSYNVVEGDLLVDSAGSDIQIVVGTLK